MPPAPVITRAWRDPQHIYVELLLPAVSADCKAATVRVGGFSEAEGSNLALPLRDDERERQYRQGDMHVVLRRPILDLPPYVVYASANGEHGERSAIARFRIPEKGDYCLRHRSVEQCVREAQALAKRCMRAEAPRAQCADWAYGSQRPYPATPVKNASVAAVRDDLQAVLARQTYNGVRLSNLTCTGELVCIATFNRNPGEGRVRVRYVLSGYHQKAGCWFATTIDVVEPPELSPPSPLQAGVPTNGQASCLAWRRP